VQQGLGLVKSARNVLQALNGVSRSHDFFTRANSDSRSLLNDQFDFESCLL